jgi:hypothetical protein
MRRKNTPAIMMASANDRNVRATVPLKSLFMTIPELAFTVAVKKSLMSEPNWWAQILWRKATYAQITKVARLATNPGFCCTPVVTGRSFELDFGTYRKTKPTASVKRETVIPIALVKRSGHWLVRSSQMVATTMNSLWESNCHHCSKNSRLPWDTCLVEHHRAIVHTGINARSLLEKIDA